MPVAGQMLESPQLVFAPGGFDRFPCSSFDHLSMHDTPPPTGPICERIVFRGRVQGVGFRQHTRGLARGFPLIGYVRNLGDGTVEVVAKGPASAIHGLVVKIQSDFQDNVTGVERGPAELSEEFTTFDIRF